MLPFPPSSRLYHCIWCPKTLCWNRRDRITQGGDRREALLHESLHLGTLFASLSVKLHALIKLVRFSKLVYCVWKGPLKRNELWEQFSQCFQKAVLIFLSNYLSDSFPIFHSHISPEGQSLIILLTRAAVFNPGSALTSLSGSFKSTDVWIGISEILM